METTAESQNALPDFLTVEEAADVLRIGRTTAYALARRYEETEGEEGLPVLRVGHKLRVPRRALEQMAGGPLTTLAMRAAIPPVPAENVRPTHPPQPSTSRRRRRVTAPESQIQLFPEAS